MRNMAGIIRIEMQWSDGERTTTSIDAEKGILFWNLIERGTERLISFRVIAPNAAAVEWLPSGGGEEVFRYQSA